MRVSGWLKRNVFKFDSVKLMESALSVFFIMILCFLVLGFVPVSHPSIHNFVLNSFKKSGVDNCNFSKVTVTAWNGIEFSNMEISGDRSSVAFSFNSPKIKISCNSLSLLLRWRKLKNDSIALPDDLYFLAFTSPQETLDTLLRFASTFYEIKKIEIVDGEWVNRHDTKEKLRIQDVSLEIMRDKDNRELIKSNIEIGAVLFSKSLATNLKAFAEYDGTNIKVTKCRGRIYGGRFRLDTEFNIHNHVMNQLSLLSSDLDLHQISMNFDSSKGNFSGNADIDISLNPSTLKFDSLDGKGVMHLKNVEISNSPLQKALVKLLDAPRFLSLEFSKAKVDFEIKKFATLMTTTVGTGGMLDFKAIGWIQMDGALNQQLESVLTFPLTNEITPLIANSLEPVGDDGCLARCRVYGNMADPRLEIDKEIMQRVVRNVFQNMRQSIKGLFRKK
jgi:hypothetical protein